MSTIKGIWDCLFSPRLIKIYGNGPVERLYEPSNLERWGDKVINSLYMMWNFGVYTSPILAGILYRKGYFVAEGLVTLTKFVTSLGVILVVSYCIRGFSRSRNPTYQKFIKTLISAQTNLPPTLKQQLSRYDFEFYAWPVEYGWDDVDSDLSKHRVNIARPILHRNSFQLIMSLPCQIIGYLAIHTFGIRLIYPGSIGLLQMVLAQGLLQGRSKLVEVNRGVRYKLFTKDRNDVDAMFVDKRNVATNGNTLVVCCEGNAGFYEIGVMGTPIEAGYSVLGWNHPGFAGSTGEPYPDQEQNAIDIVMQFAINKLGFKVENIILFGWSIGGFSASWAAMNYPDVKGIILDASFDDILPLALNQMPSWWESLVKLAVREHVNLNNYEQLVKYPGPMLLIRRTDDEVICLGEGDLSTNRGNNLLVKMMRYRYPLIFEDCQLQLLMEYLAVTSTTQDQLVQKYNVNPDLCKSLLESYISEHSKSYPMRIGDEMSSHQKNQMTIFLARKYMKDYKSTHCTPLPADMFQQPWDIHVENDYVFT